MTKNMIWFLLPLYEDFGAESMKNYEGTGSQQPRVPPKLKGGFFQSL